MDCDRIEDFVNSPPPYTGSKQGGAINQMAETKQRCTECGNDGPKPFCRGQCRKCYQRALRREKNGVESGEAAPKVRKNRPAKAGEPDAMMFLQTRAKGIFDAEVAAAQAKYDKTMEAVEIVAALAKEN